MVSTRWSPRGPCRSVQGAAHTLPNVSILSAEEQAVRRSMLPRGAAEQATWLATSVSRALLDVGPRPVQQDAACVFDIKGTTPVVVICDGHGSIQLRSGNHEMHAGGTQAADIASQVVQQYLQKYGNNFLLHSADIFMHAVRAGQPASPPAPARFAEGRRKSVAKSWPKCRHLCGHTMSCWSRSLLERELWMAKNARMGNQRWTGITSGCCARAGDHRGGT